MVAESWRRWHGRQVRQDYRLVDANEARIGKSTGFLSASMGFKRWREVGILLHTGNLKDLIAQATPPTLSRHADFTLRSPCSHQLPPSLKNITKHKLQVPPPRPPSSKFPPQFFKVRRAPILRVSELQRSTTPESLPIRLSSLPPIHSSPPPVLTVGFLHITVFSLQHSSTVASTQLGGFRRGRRADRNVEQRLGMQIKLFGVNEA